MKILFFEDPLTDKNDIYWRMGHIVLDYPIYKNLVQAGVECRMLTNEYGRECALQAGLPSEHVITLPEAEVIDCLPDPQERIHHLFHEQEHYEGQVQKEPGWLGRMRSLFSRQPYHAPAQDARRVYAESTIHALAALFRHRLQGYRPDLILSWYPIPYLRRLLPGIPVLYKEAGFFGSPPFPWSHYSDPCGFHAHSWIRRYPTRAEAPAGIPALERLRAHFLPLIRQANPFVQRMQHLRSCFRKLVLVALQANNYYLFDRSCPYRSQAHVLYDILRELPRDIGVIPTLHPGHGIVSPTERHQIYTSHPNCLFLPEAELFQAPSQYLLQDCDAVITLGSAVGWHALFHRKPLITLADCHLNPAASFPTVQALVKAFARGCNLPNRDAHLAWVIFHYSIPQSVYQRPGWAAKYYQSAINTHATNLESYYSEPALAYDDYVQEIIHTASSNIPLKKAG
ncbi:MAG: hypothetical protein U0840_06030 [Gemmataceae bacterium]